ncbi:MAG: Short-chain dehydrogenase/reductase SDR [uncultured Pyrinomonadaceae bacterium]|uniref:Short-chain dehydrogenase/reductase SDR n=1 Tax=uncultured Pyrinomonadaceae bacterium TaxID=2283094 RepID=A0A6J4NW46_9BACT|nr:MAG: Short-chain dehydrogenase/reductase SDR [uncultured Pyrinomonadaceae bacterium]
MNIRLKKLNEQVIVITGATSGIGLVTARIAAGRGARLILAARNEETLRRLADETTQAVYVVADVGKQADVRRIAEKAIEHFGGFDTWVNNAGVSIYGRVLDVSMEDHRQLFETV